ncbi:unnamed protein product [Paramecium octaurelia]|uniref:Transmembrane protein n=1 Tax=Paramecium octaurelia TaxID=43137 RepID=A0A8S1WGE5_PAROT|nr:unnamed protein product [Paramecium octaurelia]
MNNNNHHQTKPIENATQKHLELKVTTKTKREICIRENSQGFFGQIDFALLLQPDHQLRQEFCYLNNQGNPYRWKSEQYMTEEGLQFIVVILRSLCQPSNLKKILQITKILKQKTFAMWKKLSIKNKAQSISGDLTACFLLLDPSLKRPKRGNLQTHSKDQEFSIFYPQLNESSKQNEVHKKILKILEHQFNIQNSCGSMTILLQFFQRGSLQQKSLTFGVLMLYLFIGQFYFQSNLRQFQWKRIKKFTRMVDYIQFKSMITLMYNSINNFLKVLKKANKYLKLGNCHSYSINDLFQLGSHGHSFNGGYHSV